MILKKIAIIIKLAIILTSFLLIVAAFNVYIAPSKSTIPAFIGLFSPFLFWINFLLLLLLLFTKKYRFFFVVLLSLILYLPLSFNFFKLHLKSPQSDSKTYRLVSYNVRQFDHYNWIKELGTSSRLYSYIRNINTEILCIQEFFQSPNKKFNSIDSLKESTWEYYAYSPYYRKGSNLNSGLIIFSKYPIIEARIISFPNSINKGLYVDIKLNMDTIRVYNVHLESVHLDNPDYKFINGSFANQKNGFTSISKIYNKLAHAFIQRAVQIHILKASIEQSPYPVLLCGDFNDTPISYAYKQMTGFLSDAFAEVGFGIGKTYVGHFPWLRIDYIFHNKSIQINHFYISKVHLSDHYPIMVQFELK